MAVLDFANVVKVVIGSFSLAFSGLGFYTSYCQLLDQVYKNILYQNHNSIRYRNIMQISLFVMHTNCFVSFLFFEISFND